VHVGNLVHAALHALGDDRARGRRYLVSDGDDLSTADLLRRLGDAMGRRVRLLALPSGALRVALQAVGRGAEAERLLESFRVDSSAIRRELGWAPPFTVAQGLAETVRWWQAQRKAA
jgi:nucleoside-diphosphate-sugar epimerase